MALFLKAPSLYLDFYMIVCVCVCLSGWLEGVQQSDSVERGRLCDCGIIQTLLNALSFCCYKKIRLKTGAVRDAIVHLSVRGSHF